MICKHFMLFVQLHYCILYDFHQGGLGLVSSSTHSSALISKTFIAFVTGVRQVRRFSTVYGK